MKNDSNIVSSAVLGDWALMGLRRVRELAESGIFVKAGRGRYDLKASLQGLIKHQRELAAGRAGIDAGTDVASANVELKREQAKMARLRYQLAAGNLISIAVLRGILDPITLAMRNMFLGLPSKIAFEIPVLTPTDRATIVRICRDDLEDGAMGKGYFAIVKARQPDDGPVVDEEQAG
jgi:phage terminase Nu1 subunit (DNA packaging protein)